MKKFLFTLLLVGAAGLYAEARTVTGAVISGKEKLSEVIVTDGTNFTKTGKNGKFTFDINDDAAFVYIVTPSGYAGDWTSGVPAFYQPAEGKDHFVFDLKFVGDCDTYNIIAVGDPQPRSDAQFEEFAGAPLDDLAKTAATLPGVTVAVALGDVCYDKLHLQKRWKEEIVRAGIPFYTAVGNHDHDQQYKDDYNSIRAYRENLGPENYALFLGDDILIVLDNIIYEGRSNYREGYTDAIIAWVNALMEYVDEDADIYVAQHSPLNGRHGGKMVVNHKKMLKALEGHKVSFISGHNHVNVNSEYAEGVREHNVAAICGTWWDTDYCTDGTPKGFKIFTKKDDTLTWYYKSLGRDRSFQFEVYKPGECRENPDCVVVNVWDYDPCWRVEWYQDGEYKGIMYQVDEYSPRHAAALKAKYDALGRTPSEYRLTRKARHYFAADPSSKASKVTVKVTDRFGNVYTEDLLLK